MKAAFSHMFLPFAGSSCKQAEKSHFQSVPSHKAGRFLFAVERRTPKAAKSFSMPGKSIRAQRGTAENQQKERIQKKICKRERPVAI